MTLLLDNQFKPLPPDRSVDTQSFLEAVSHLPSFFGECGPPGVAAPTFAYFLVAGTSATLSIELDEAES